MADSGSSLAAALAEVRDPFAYEETSAYWVGVPELNTIIDAARERLRLSKVPCETCLGLGRLAKNDLAPSYPCPSCGGSGEVWPAELVEVVASVGIPRSHSARSFATAVLNALAVYAKEAK